MKHLISLSILFSALFSSGLVAKTDQIHVNVTGNFGIDAPPCGLNTSNTVNVSFGMLDYASLNQNEYTSEKKPLQIQLNCTSPAKVNVYIAGTNIQGQLGIFKTTHPSIGVFIEDLQGDKLTDDPNKKEARFDKAGVQSFNLNVGLKKTDSNIELGNFNYNIAVVFDVTHL